MKRRVPAPPYPRQGPQAPVPRVPAVGEITLPSTAELILRAEDRVKALEALAMAASDVGITDDDRAALLVDLAERLKMIRALPWSPARNDRALRCISARIRVHAAPRIG